MSDEKILEILTDIRNWTRAASYSSVRVLLETALPDAKSRAVYQMSDGTRSRDQIRVACKVSPNSMVSLTQRCAAMGLMKVTHDNKRIRLFDLADFNMIENEQERNGERKNEREIREETGH